MDVDLFYPDPYSRFEAQEVCNSCPVTDECLDYAFSIGDRDGVFGGMTTSQRQKYRYRRK